MATPKGDVFVEINQSKADKLSGDAIERGIRRATIAAENAVFDDLSQPGRGNPRRDGSRASAPGDPPATDTGRLRGSLASEVSRRGGETIGTVSANTEYAAHLEFGTERMAARPFMSRLLKEHVERIKRAFRIGAKL